MASEQTLDQNAGTVPLEASLQSVDVHLKVEFVLLRTRLVTVVSDMPAHVLIHPSKSVTKRGIFDPLLVRDHVVVQCLQLGHTVHYEMSIPRDVTHRVGEQSDMQHALQSCQRLKVLPLG